MPGSIRVLLIEDNRFLRDGIAEMLRNHGGFTVDPRTDGDASLAQLESVRAPDVVLMTSGPDKEHSLKLMAALRERFPEARVVPMAIPPEQADIVDFVKAGGVGFILQNAASADYVKTIQAVAAGSTVLPPALTASLFAQIAVSDTKNAETTPAGATQLTRREREVVDLIATGMSNKEIAQQLHIATFTVKSHVHNVLAKLELTTRLQIAVFVRDGQPPQPPTPAPTGD